MQSFFQAAAMGGIPPHMSAMMSAAAAAEKSSSPPAVAAVTEPSEKPLLALLQQSDASGNSNGSGTNQSTSGGSANASAGGTGEKERGGANSSSRHSASALSNDPKEGGVSGQADGEGVAIDFLGKRWRGDDKSEGERGAEVGEGREKKMRGGAEDWETGRHLMAGEMGSYAAHYLKGPARQARAFMKGLQNANPAAMMRSMTFQEH